MSSEKFVVEKMSSVLRDLRESSFIYENDKLCMDGGDYTMAFEHDGIAIYNPYVTENGMDDVSPIEYYGEKYIRWYNSLGASKYEDEIESINIHEHYLTENWIVDDSGHYDYTLDDDSMFIKNNELYVWIDRGEYKIGEGDFEYLKKVSLRYLKMLMYAGDVTGIDYVDMMIHPTENTIQLMSEDFTWCDAMDFDEFIDENTHDGDGVEL